MTTEEITAPWSERIVISKSATMHYTGVKAFRSQLAGVGRIGTYCDYHVREDEELPEGSGERMCAYCTAARKKLLEQETFLKNKNGR